MLYDIPADARPECVYGTPEFEARRLHRVSLPRRHVKAEEGASAVPESASEMIATYAAIRERFRAPRHALCRPAAVEEPVAEPVPAPAEAPDPVSELPPTPEFWFAEVEEPEPEPVERDWLFLAAAPTIASIIVTVASYYGVTRNDILSQRRAGKIMRARLMSYYLAKTLTPKSYPQIALAIGGRDHTSVMSGVRRIEKLMMGDEQLKADIKALTDKIGGWV